MAVEEVEGWEGVSGLLALAELNSELAVAYLKDVELELGTAQLKLAEAVDTPPPEGGGFSGYGARHLKGLPSP